MNKKNFIQSKILPTTIVEERSMGNTAVEMNVFSRLVMERILFLSGEVTEDTIDTLIGQMLFLDSINHQPINLYIDSPGGSCYAGLALIGVMDFIKSPVHTTILGLAASMGAVIASCGEKGHRYALPYSRFMIHQPSSNFGYSKYTDSKIALEEMESVKKDLYEILTKTSGHSLEEIEQLCNNGDKWMKPNDAIGMGFIDKVITKQG